MNHLLSDVVSDLGLARRVLEMEAAAIVGVMERLDGEFERAIALLFDCRGRVVVTGMGKSGIICRKIAATLSSTGTPALFLNPAEAAHGDLGVIQRHDIVLALSRSGETAELIRLLATIRRRGARVIALTGCRTSTLGKAADVTLDCYVSGEACPLNLAPTASTTAALALGDAIAMTLLVRKGFREEDFADLHPAGTIGKRLTRVDALMRLGSQMPVVAPHTAMRDVIYEMSCKGVGMTCVLDAAGRPVGVITDGDLRRQMAEIGDIMSRRAADVMTRDPVTIDRRRLALDALNLMEVRKITSLPVVDADDVVCGVVHLHDLW